MAYPCARDDWVVAACRKAGGGKSGLHRAGCQITSGGRKPTASAAESIPPMASSRIGTGKGERVR